MKTKVTIILSILAITCQAQFCNCEENSFKQDLAGTDPAGLATVTAACVSDVFMGQQTILFCIHNFKARRIHVFIQATILTATGREVVMPVTDDYVGPNKTVMPGWTQALSYVFDDHLRTKYGDAKRIKKIKVWTE